MDKIAVHLLHEISFEDGSARHSIIGVFDSKDKAELLKDKLNDTTLFKHKVTSHVVE